MTKPYKEKEITGFILHFNKPNVPNLLEFIILSRGYEDMSDMEKEEFKQYFYSINGLIQRTLDLNRSLSKTKEDIQLQIDRGKEALGRKDKSKSLLDRDQIKNQIKMLEAMLEEKDKYKDKDFLIEFDRFLATEFTDKFLEETIKTQWLRVESHYDILGQWRYIFSSVIFNNDDIPDGKFTVYRAGTKEGYSWAGNLDRAKWFYNRNEDGLVEANHNQLLKLDVTKDDVLFYYSDRTEDEYVLIPNQNKIQVIPMGEDEI